LSVVPASVVIRANNPFAAISAMTVPDRNKLISKGIS
jgi:hypothetical protein